MVRSSAFFAYQGGAGRVKGLEKHLARLAAMPERAKAELAKAADVSADDLVSNIKAVAPVDPADDRGEHVKDHIYKQAGRHELARQVIADAKDEKGRPKVPPLEFGHIDERSGEHVPPTPFFFPTIRRRKASIKARMSRATSKAVEASS